MQSTSDPVTTTAAFQTEPHELQVMYHRVQTNRGLPNTIPTEKEGTWSFRLFSRRTITVGKWSYRHLVNLVLELIVFSPQ